MTTLEKFVSFLLFAIIVGSVQAQHDPHFTQNRTTVVHLFEWRWNDIAEECERFLGPFGYGGVQTSPPNENIIVNDPARPWWERYQPISYKLETRSGNEQEFQSMVRRCNSAGVRIYIDAVINHMSGARGTGTGTGGSYYDSGAQQYDGVPYSNLDFNGANCPTASGDIENYGDAIQVRNCKLVGLNDLNQGADYVRGKIVEFLNKLVSYGVAGFRVDASKHMWPGDMKAIFDQLNNLPTDQGFPANAKPFIFQEVIDLGGEAIAGTEYVGNGRVTEFKVCANIGNVFRKWNGQQLSNLKNWGEGWGMLDSGNSLVFVDNHDNQRGHGAGGASILTYKDSRLYKMAQAFNLAWPYGVTRVMSSYDFVEDFTGPPHDGNYNILPVPITADGTCGDGWICEHRWRQIFNMVAFRNIAKGASVTNWWDNGRNQIAFSLGDRGFLAINNDDFGLDTAIQTSLADGNYCDVISGNLENGGCTGKTITVSGGNVNVNIGNSDEDPMIAIHAGSKL